MIRTSVQDWVAVIEVNDFAPLGAGDAGFAGALRDAVVDLSDDDEVKVVVLRSTGDFATDRSTRLPAAEAVFTTWQQEFAGASAVHQALTFSKKVTVTEVSGNCSGAGTMLVLATDITVAAEDARFASPFRGHPEANFVLAALTVRLDRAKAWMLRDSVLDAETARSYGLVNEVIPRSELSDGVASAAARIARMPLDGVVMSKMLQQPVLDASGVGREFDLAGFYAHAAATACPGGNDV
ncbi:hypothetical protein GIS00_00480 [Nakamurella sp. YIM 132087]|uniref:Enoyl-CoA hydratase/isomerase family protein n=1 Tax=Nakamurella alba TaxID=2665158 RepID=A0A7K1FE94_9ACTN|nr:enoyl-CoA hydratase/isomerase family protein [Nakamurella alba]MTD12418.1 hypothetical protein [Nakamurella alba]